MAKLVTGLFLIYVTIIQFYSVFGFDNATDNADLIDENRLIISGIIRIKCRALLGTQSTVLPSLAVTLTRLANGRLYFFSPPTPASTRLTFDNARTFCREHGMHLVTINSAEENVLVYNKATELTTAQLPAIPGAWIGYRDVTGTGIYQWTYPPKVGTPPNFFAAAQPVPAQCAGYVSAAAPAATSWTTYPCAAPLRPFICEMEPPCSLVL